MPTLLEVQRSIHRSLVACDDEAAAAFIIADGLAGASRLNIYRNTFIGTLTTALRLSFPAVHNLIGTAFFESAARIFIEAHPPRSAWLDEYGDGFPSFLAAFGPAAAAPYLADVARLEWAVSSALHAPDVPVLDLRLLAEIDPAEQARVVLTPHPSLRLVRSDYPVDTIWRAVLTADDAAMARIDLAAGPVWLLVERRSSGVEVTACSEPAWRFASALFAAHPIQAAIDAAAPEIDAVILLADHLAAGRFVDFALADHALATGTSEVDP